MDANLSQTISNVTASLALAFACALRFSRPFQILNPLVSRPNLTRKPGASRRAERSLFRLSLDVEKRRATTVGEAVAKPGSPRVLALDPVLNSTMHRSVIENTVFYRS